MFKHILVPTDGSELSRESARRAVSFAKSAGAHVTAIYVKPKASIANEGDLMDPSALDHLSDGSDKRAKEYLGYIKKLCKEQGVKCRTVTAVSNHAYKAIIETAGADDCDLIFMASHGPGGLQSLLLGSETQKVLIHSDIPVLVYRAQPKEPRRRKKA
jgi:nucleotide-binding universal stress UspA family protein